MDDFENHIHHKRKLRSFRPFFLPFFAIILYKENQREYCIIETHDEDYVLQMEIGALTAGKIHNLPIDIVEKAREKGYFSLGGSTIIVAYAKDTISLDQDIEKYSGENIETLVELGERLGKRNVS